MELAIKIAGKVDKSLGTSTKAANKQLATIQKAANKASTVMTAGLAAMGTGAIAATKYLADLGGEWQTATNQMASATGAAGEELENLRDVMENVYADNFGEDVADVADAVALVDRNLANLDQEGLTKATTRPRAPWPFGTLSSTTWRKAHGRRRQSERTSDPPQRRRSA